MFLTKSEGEKEVRLHKYNPMDRTFDHFSGSLTLSEDEVIRKIGVDWSQFYVLRQKFGAPR